MPDTSSIPVTIGLDVLEALIAMANPGGANTTGYQADCIMLSGETSSAIHCQM